MRLGAIAAKLVLWGTGLAVGLAALVYIAFQISPWPSALLIRHASKKDEASISLALKKYVPDGITAQRNEHYAADDSDAYLDVFYPSVLAESQQSLPTIVWTHGGGWVSGDKDQIANYAMVLAGKGFTVASVGYSLAPRSTYPTPIRQVNAALSYLVKNANRLRVNPLRIVLAGDSAGADISAQLANAISVPSYAKAVGISPSIRRSELAGVLLYCGAYTIEGLNLGGPFGNFLRTVLWSYSGGRDFRTNTHFATAGVINYVTAEFPSTFISAGNADPLVRQSIAFAEALASRKVRVESLFFSENYEPALPHEYQFNLDKEAGQLALERSVDFLRGLR